MTAPTSKGREQLEAVMREHYRQPAKEICNAVAGLRDASRMTISDERGDEALIDDKTVFIVKRT